MDQLSEKLHTAIPYAYVMNNPAMLIDPDGRDAMFSSGTEEILNQYMVNTYWKKSSSLVPGYSGSAIFGFSGINAPTQYSKTVNVPMQSYLVPGTMTFDMDWFTKDAEGIVNNIAEVGFKPFTILFMDRWEADAKTLLDKASNFLDGIWNSNFARNYVSDSYSIGLSSNVAAIFGVGTTPINFTLLTRGKEPGLYFTPSVNASQGDGIEANAGVVFGSGIYTGNPRSITSNMLQGNSYGLSVGLGLEVDASVGVSYAPTGLGNGFINASGQIGVGIEGSPVTLVNIQATYQYTPIVKPIFQFK